MAFQYSPVLPYTGATCSYTFFRLDFSITHAVLITSKGATSTQRRNMKMIAIIIGLVIIFCIVGTRKWTKKTAENTKELVRWEKLPSHIKEMEYVNNLPREERRVIMRRQMIEIHGEEVANWSHEDVRAAYNAWQRDRLLQRRI
jgi:hypothetical protein